MEKSFTCKTCGVVSIKEKSKGRLPEYCPGCRRKRDSDRIARLKEKKAQEALMRTGSNEY